MADLLDNTPAAPPALFEGPVLWVPEFLIDEVSPAPRASPDDWIVAIYCRADQPATAVLLGEEEPVGPMVKGEHRICIIGETVMFCSFQDFGSIEVSIAADGSFEIFGPAHPSAKCFWTDGDADTVAMSIDDFARDWAANVQQDEPDRVTIEHHTWSAPQPFQVVLNGDRAAFAPAIVPVGAAA